ncbi:MAG: SIMPL domain-containing protein [Pyrinomonadaceae bacterium]|jgi:hypothetical protein|nr:SIMPL domain-containing protein [Pyrinomonadaceae bacterium]
MKQNNFGSRRIYKMKKYVLFICLLLALCANCFAQDLDKTPQIAVTGNAEVLVEPDEALISLDVTKLDKVLDVAKKQNDETTAKILEVTRKFNIPAQNVNIRNISVEIKNKVIRDPKKPVYDEDGDLTGEKIFIGYEVSKTIRIKYLELKRFEELFSELLKTGVTEVNNVNFETSKLRQYKDQARDMAIKAAKEKATAMAASIGQTIGKAIKITEGTISNTSLNYGNFSANSTANVFKPSAIETVSTNIGSFSPGTITVSASATVIFILN